MQQSCFLREDQERNFKINKELCDNATKLLVSPRHEFLYRGGDCHHELYFEIRAHPG